LKIINILLIIFRNKNVFSKKNEAEEFPNNPENRQHSKVNLTLLKTNKGTAPKTTKSIIVTINLRR